MTRILTHTSLILCLFAASANAAESSGSYTGANGNTVTYDRSATVENGTVNHTTTYTGPAGKNVTVDGSASKGVNGGTITGPRGKTASYNGTTVRGNGSMTHSGTVTGPRGKARSHTRTKHRN